MRSFTRRQTIAALLGGSAVAGALTVGIRFSDERHFVRAMVERGVGPFRMEDTQFVAFVEDLHFGDEWRDKARLGAFTLLSVSGGALVPHAPGDLGGKYERLERLVVTNFLTRTDYLQIDNKAQAVTFVGDNGCSNPFAVFDSD